VTAYRVAVSSVGGAEFGGVIADSDWEAFEARSREALMSGTGVLEFEVVTPAAPVDPRRRPDLVERAPEPKRYLIPARNVVRVEIDHVTSMSGPTLRLV